jgi:hypothetical protein
MLRMFHRIGACLGLAGAVILVAFLLHPDGAGRNAGVTLMVAGVLVAALSVAIWPIPRRVLRDRLAASLVFGGGVTTDAALWANAAGAPFIVGAMVLAVGIAAMTTLPRTSHRSAP